MTDQPGQLPLPFLRAPQPQPGLSNEPIIDATAFLEFRIFELCLHDLDDCQFPKAVRPGGRVAYPHGVQPVPTGRPDVEVIGYDGTADREVVDKLNALIEIRPFSLYISDRFALVDASQAHRVLMNHHAGRVALQVA